MLPATNQCADFSTCNARASRNFAQLGEYPCANPPSPTNSLSPRTASPASASCPTVSSLETRRSTSLDPDKLQTPILALSDLASSGSATGTIHSKSSAKDINQKIPCIRVNPSGIPSSHGPTTSVVDEDELDDLRWSIGVPRHMIDVFRANPFTSMDLSRHANTILPSFDTSTAADTIERTNGVSLRAVSTAKRKVSNSPESAKPRKKGRSKRARIKSPLVLPFPATGAQEMYAYEFRVDLPCWDGEFACVENNGWSNRSSSPGLVDSCEHLPAAQSGMTYHSEDTCMRPPVDCEVAALSSPSCFSHSYSHNASFPPRASPRHHMHTPHFPFLPSASFHPQISPRCGTASNSLVPASGLDNNESWTRFQERECNSLLQAFPTQVMPENIQTRPPSATPLDMSPPKPLYACPLCPRDFQLPNGLALHLKWHDRVSGSTRNLAVWQGMPRNRTTTKISRMELGQPDGRDLSNIQSSAQGDDWDVAFGRQFSSHTLPQGSTLVPAETVRKSLERGIPNTDKFLFRNSTPTRFHLKISPKNVRCFATRYNWMATVACRWRAIHILHLLTDYQCCSLGCVCFH